MNKKIIYIFIIVVLIIAGVFIATKISDKTQTEQTSANDLGENENNLNEENNINQNNESLVESGENNTGTQDNNQDNLEEKAKQIVKENWGEDETVYFSYDGKDETGRYIICVREKETTKAIYRYYVDIDTGTFDIE